MLSLSPLVPPNKNHDQNAYYAHWTSNGCSNSYCTYLTGITLFRIWKQFNNLWVTDIKRECYTVWQVSTLSLIVLYCFTTDFLHCTRILAKIVRDIPDGKITICATGIGPFMSHERASNLLLSGCVSMFPLWFYTTIQYIWHKDGHLSIIISTWPRWSF